jgi:hypothetical protein
MTVAAVSAASEAETQREDKVEPARLTMMRRRAEHGRLPTFVPAAFGNR